MTAIQRWRQKINLDSTWKQRWLIDVHSTFVKPRLTHSQSLQDKLTLQNQSWFNVHWPKLEQRLLNNVDMTSVLSRRRRSFSNKIQRWSNVMFPLRFHFKCPGSDIFSRELTLSETLSSNPSDHMQVHDPYIHSFLTNKSSLIQDEFHHCSSTRTSERSSCFDAILSNIISNELDATL